MRVLTSDITNAGAEPLGASEFAALIQRFAPVPEKLALAVSGGPDSMALAFCVKRWREENKNISVIAFIVDHGLRPESAHEAESVKSNLAALNIPAKILRWEHQPVVTRLHITARKARYKLLTESCHAHGIKHLLLAHQREDQAETILMRLAKGSGIDGLAGIAAESAMDNVHLWRPFLPIAKERLIATCAANTIPFIADPSNASDKYARGRLRRVMPMLASEGLTVGRLADLGARAADAKDALNHYTLELLHVATTMDAAGVIRFDLEQLRNAPRATAERALSLCLQTVHGEEYAPEHASLVQLLAALTDDNPETVRTLHGCLISKSPAQAVIMRELAAITDALPIQAGQTVVWDGRWRVTVRADIGDKTYTVRPLGHPPHAELDSLSPRLRRHIPQGRARAVLPALWHENKLAIIPDDEKKFAEAALLALWPPASNAG